VIRRLFTLCAVGVLVWLLLVLADSSPPVSAASSTFMLGFVLLAAALTGEIVEQVRLPRITGYLLAGVLFGPYAAGFLTPRSVESLTIFNDMAFAFIGLAAGSELRLHTLRGRWTSILLLVASTTAVVVVGVGVSFFALASWTGFLGDMVTVQALAVAGMVGVIAVARSPSSVIAVISETGARGAFSDTILGVTMAIDVVVMCMFSVAIALSGLAFAPEGGMDVSFVLTLTGEILASVILGLALGAIMTLYLKHEGPQIPLVIAGVCFLVYRCAGIIGGYLDRVHDLSIHLEPLLICATAGFAIQNLTRHGGRLIEAMDGVALPVYVLFFTFAGAGLDLPALRDSWSIALVIVVCRIVTMFAGGRIATSLAGEPPEYRRNCWLGFITQAGLSLALIVQIERSFEGWGTQLATVLVAAVAINQLIGPAAFKIALERVGEVRRRQRVWRTAS